VKPWPGGKRPGLSSYTKWVGGKKWRTKTGKMVLRRKREGGEIHFALGEIKKVFPADVQKKKGRPREMKKWRRLWWGGKSEETLKKK